MLPPHQVLARFRAQGTGGCAGAASPEPLKKEAEVDKEQQLHSPQRGDCYFYCRAALLAWRSHHHPGGLASVSACSGKCACTVSLKEPTHATSALLLLLLIELGKHHQRGHAQCLF